MGIRFDSDPGADVFGAMRRAAASLSWGARVTGADRQPVELQQRTILSVRVPRSPPLVEPGESVICADCRRRPLDGDEPGDRCWICEDEYSRAIEDDVD